MRYVYFITTLFLLGAGCVQLRERVAPQKNILTEWHMKLSSPAFENNGPIPSVYTCDGEDKNPPLEIGDIPPGTQSLTLIVDDPDAPGGDWVHWTVWNIPPATARIEENSVPAGAVEGTTNFGKPGYGGPCPPSGIHRYQFKLYALDTTLSLSQSATKQAILNAMGGHILAHRQLTGLYQRSQ